MEAILALVRSRSGHDFANYKRRTLFRRIHRRMGLNNVETLSNCECPTSSMSPTETERLTNDLMISVTDFFRDLDAWEAVGASVLTPRRRARNGRRSALLGTGLRLR